MKNHLAADSIRYSIMRLVWAFAASALLCTSSLAQSANSAQVYSGGKLTTQFDDLVHAAHASGSSGATLGDFQTHAIKLSVRTSSGGAEIHQHYDDIFVVTDGSATLVTGGQVLDAKMNAGGETTGSGIAGGTRQAIRKGDVVHIPAGTPHQLILAPGETYSSIVVKVKE